MKKGILVKPPQWWKHLRPYYKRLVWRKQRLEDQKEIKTQLQETEENKAQKEEDKQDLKFDDFKGEQ